MPFISNCFKRTGTIQYNHKNTKPLIEKEENQNEKNEEGRIRTYDGSSNSRTPGRYSDCISEFIMSYQNGEDTFSENESAKYAVNLLADLGTKRLF